MSNPIFYTGRDAHDDGQGVDQNPHAFATGEYDDWEAGWLEAEADEASDADRRVS